jgi:hypothetical protein
MALGLAEQDIRFAGKWEADQRNFIHAIDIPALANTIAIPARVAELVDAQVSEACPH